MAGTPGIRFFAAGLFTRDNSASKVELDEADVVVFGRLFISNPDLVRRLAEGFPLHDYSREPPNQGAPEKGYTDYLPWQESS